MRPEALRKNAEAQAEGAWVSEGKAEELTEILQALSVQFSRCDPMNRSTPGLPVHHQL